MDYVTSSPTGLPTSIPSKAPTSNVPTAPPTITGSVVFVDMVKTVTSTLTEDEIADLISSAEESFGVYPGKVEAEVSYEITGQVALTTDGIDISEEELITALQESIAETLDVHPSDVKILIDPETNVATYTISSSTSEEAQNLQQMLQEESTNDAIGSDVSERIPSVTGVTYKFHLFLFNLNVEVAIDPEYGVVADVRMVVDTTDTDDVASAIEEFENLTDDWNVATESVFITSQPTKSPSHIPTAEPTTPVPSAKPSITGLIITVDVPIFVDPINVLSCMLIYLEKF